MNPAKSMAKGGLGWLEGGAQMLTGLGGAAIGGLSGLGTLMTGGGVEKAAKNASYLSSALTYQPRSEEGQGVSQALAAPMELASKGTGYVGEKIGGMLGPIERILKASNYRELLKLMQLIPKEIRF